MPKAPPGTSLATWFPGLDPTYAELLDALSERLRSLGAVVEFLVPYDRGDVLAALHRDGEVLIEVHADVGTRVRARVDDGQVRLEGRVRDTGAELGAKLAEAFEADQDGEGAGLPLSLARGVLASMGGALHAETNAGLGATMLFQLTAEAAEEPAPAVDERAASGAAHVLVADHDRQGRPRPGGDAEVG